MGDKFTPGNWIVEFARINQGGAKHPYVMSRSFSCCIGRIAGNTDEEAIANAHLIASAPSLLEALDGLTLVVGLTAFKHEGQRAALQEAMDIGRGAIRLARGEG